MENRLKERMEGVLPIIKIGKDRFVFDIMANALYHKGATSPIYIHNMSRSKKGLRFLYHPDTRTMAPQPLTPMLTYPEDVVIIQLPFPVALDPVGFAKMHCIKTSDLLSIIPFKAVHEAKVIPWHKTRFSNNIGANQLQKNSSKQTLTKGDKKRKAKRPVKIKM